MPMNRVQYQKALLLPEFMNRYGIEEQCDRHWWQLRAGLGASLPGLWGDGHTSFRREERLYWQCAGYQFQCSVTSGTIEATKLPLTRSWR